MPPIPEKSTGIDLGLFTIPQSLLLQVGTTSLLMLVLAQKAANQTLEAIGQASEEVFRSDRLPILDFPQPEQSSK
ncbi:hypothetical protein [Calothrix sp. 336/3]|uniref:hypothetical protein n=1 Tax=Calothrix sp. 336/3 TaxID=1337936 RepID=UPI0004E3B8EF|nr:hypothetical protein [Calothrix sp. 336/3]AKG24424.1 hypothetical protein IJ00_03840 [Calothrix sp. 336/3]